MEIKFLGTGSAFTLKSFQTSVLLSENNKNFLIDAGSDIRFSLNKQGLSYKDIDAVYITHQHGDHIGGLEYLAFCTYYDPSVTKKIKLFGNVSMLSDAWINTLRGGLLTNLSDYFDVNTIPNGGSFVWEHICFELYKFDHIKISDTVIMPSYGLLISDLSNKIFFTGDSQFNYEKVGWLYNFSDIIIQDCETYPFKSGVHAHYDELKTLPDDIKKKMYLIHVNDNVLTENGKVIPEWKEKVKKDGFIEIVENGFLAEV